MQRRMGWRGKGDGEMGNRALMDWATAEHLYAWMERNIAADEQHDVEQAVHAALRDEPDMVERGKTWWQIMDHGYALQGRKAGAS